jgi:hypothetical protein
MLRAAVLGCVFVLPALFAAGQLDLGAENLVTENAQIPLGHPHNYRHVCHSIARNILPTSQVFSPGAVFALLSVRSIAHRLC